jgi:hypothetical protein
VSQAEIIENPRLPAIARQRVAIARLQPRISSMFAGIA